MNNKLVFVLSAKRILSVNELYKARLTYIGGRPVATIYKAKDAKLTESYIREQVEGLDVKKNYPWITKDTLFKMTIKVIFKSGFLMRDLDNTIKLLQDGIFRALDINDSHVVSIVADKSLFPDIKEEKIYVCLEECSKDGVRFDYIPRPRIIWSEDLELKNLKELPQKGLRKNTLYKTDQKDKADTFIFTITPENLTLIKSTQIALQNVESIIGSTGFVYIAIQKGMKEVDDLKALFIEQQKKYSGIKIKEFEELNEQEILNWINE